MANEQKTPLPDLDEIASMARKFCHDIKESVTSIYDDYKEKHCDDAESGDVEKTENSSDSSDEKPSDEKQD